ncbi:glyoxylate reductase [Pyrofollis japonicus]|uniref:glyoxylate reductase n=1 Tax=Pyrofollis japonicus TaxID=3060460 RepID=UPI00295B6AF3|nr:glyoxylate reductase [Pyrofollis japonicus]BEP17092.1 glyoxylate reductase [Pyrofollis japonicus]
MKPRLFITRRLPGPCFDRLLEEFDAEVWPEWRNPPYDIIAEKASEVDGLVTLLTDRIDCKVIETGSRNKLRIIAQYAVGYDNIDVECATRHRVYVTNTPDVLTEAVAELTWGLILAAARHIVHADAYVRRGDWYNSGTAWHPELMLGLELRGKTLGIVGFGRIGRAVARIGAHGFGMRVLYYSRHRADPLIEKEIGAEYVPLYVLLRESDIVSIHVPLNNETRHMISEPELRLMKPTAILVNTARGAVVDTKALVKALQEHWIAAAALDVFEEEPLPPDHPLTKLDNVVLAPHIGSATRRAREAMTCAVLENLLAFKNGKVPPNLVNQDVVSKTPPGFSIGQL